MPMYLPHATTVVIALAGIFPTAPIALAGDPPGVEANATQPADTDLAVLTRGVQEIAAPGIPGPLAVFGERAFVVVTGRVEAQGTTLLAPVVAAGYLGRGRVVAFGHTGYLDAHTLTIADTGALVENAIQWAGAPLVKGKLSPRVGVIELREFAAALRERGFHVSTLRDTSWESHLDNIDVLCLSHVSMSASQAKAAETFVASGHGLVISGLGWGWLQLNSGKDLDAHPGNILLAKAGIAWCDGYLSRTGKSGYVLEPEHADRVLLPLCHAKAALNTLLGDAAYDEPRDQRLLKQACWTVSNAVRAIRNHDDPFLTRLCAVRQPCDKDLIPSASKPIGTDKPLERVLVALENTALNKLPPLKTPAAPASAEFPGSVPPKVPRVTRTITVRVHTSGWQSTGLYAAPGDAIDIVPGRAPGATIRIGAHTDRLWSNDPWRRMPDISRVFPITSEKMKLASAFGGLIYIDVARDSKSGTEVATFKIEGAIGAPRFVLNKTLLDDWRTSIRKLPAPWAELESSKIILTLPSRVVRSLDDPEAVMRFWDRVADAHVTLAGTARYRPRLNRYVTDVQISAGYMHSGYPIMTHLDVAEHFVDLKRLEAGDAWGFFHELGHNHQSADWTFDGTGEVTCNLFTLHALETVCHLPAGKRGHDAVDKPPSIAKYIADGAKFEQWKRDPFLALQMYIQLRDAFGWEAYKKVFAEYLALPKPPRTDDEKRDQWMVRFSRATDRNLGPFFQAWGVPTSKAARDSIADLPSWMPPDWPKP